MEISSSPKCRSLSLQKQHTAISNPATRGVLEEKQVARGAGSLVSGEPGTEGHLVIFVHLSARAGEGKLQREGCFDSHQLEMPSRI